MTKRVGGFQTAFVGLRTANRTGLTEDDVDRFVELGRVEPQSAAHATYGNSTLHELAASPARRR